MTEVWVCINVEIELLNDILSPISIALGEEQICRQYTYKKGQLCL